MSGGCPRSRGRPAGLKIVGRLFAVVDTPWRREPVYESDAGSGVRGPALLPLSTRVRLSVSLSVPASSRARCLERGGGRGG